MPARRTSVRYNGTRCDLCSYCVSHPTTSFCAHPACYIYSRWRRPRAPRGPHAGRWQHGNDQIELTKTARSSSRPSFRPSSRTARPAPRIASLDRPSPRQRPHGHTMPYRTHPDNHAPPRPRRHQIRITGRTRIEQQQRREKTRRTETSEATNGVSEGIRADKNGAHRNRHACLRIGPQ